jgi:hypothetical protein
MAPSSTNPDSGDPKRWANKNGLNATVASDDFTVYIFESPRNDRKRKENMLCLGTYHTSIMIIHPYPLNQAGDMYNIYIIYIS